jgi:outer membrane biosynthesis protein TonB
MEGGGKSMGRRFGRGARRGEVVEQTIDTLLGALIAVEQARDALENVRGRFGKTKRTRREGRAYGKLVERGIAVLLLLTSTALAFWLLRRRAREETAPTTPAPEEGVEEATPPETEVEPPGPPSAEDVSPREEPPPGEERPERRGATPTAPPTPREEPPPGEERPGRR